MKEVAICILKSNALKSAKYDTALQVTLRVVSFILNAFIVRHVSSATFAVMTVRLYLLYSTGLLLAREAFRRAALGKSATTSMRKLINLIWLGTAFSVPLSFVGWFIWCRLLEEPPKDVTTHYETAVLSIVLCLIIEVATEVPYVLSELHLWAKTKVVIEGCMHLLRSLLLAFGIYLWPSKAVLIFGYSYAAGSVLYFILYYSMYARLLSSKTNAEKLLIANFRSLFPSVHSQDIKNEIDIELWKVSWSFFKQGWVKEVLTEGELYLMNFFPLISLSQQGIYQVVNNLGSLAARLVFRSIEAAAYKFFVQTLQRGKQIRNQDKKKIIEVSEMLQNLLSNLIFVSLVMVVYGFSYSHSLLWLYGGSSLSEEGTLILRAHCFYMVFLAINGISESYVFAAMNDIQLERYNYYLVLFSLVYIFMTVVFTQLFGTIGFVLGNCINMLLRIISSCIYIRDHFVGSPYNPLESLIVSLRMTFVLALVFLTTRFSEIWLENGHFLLHISVGAVSLLLMVYILRFEIQTLIEIILNIMDDVLSTCSPIGVPSGHFCRNYFLDSIHHFLFTKKYKIN